jgi:mono/diheme cytochrome c family protein
MDRLQHSPLQTGSLIVLASLVWLSSLLVILNGMVLAQGTPKTGKGIRSQVNARAGRGVFNGKGVCYYCHGIDGYWDKLPRLPPDTAGLIAQLNPQPADLRNPKTLSLKSDNARAKIIREGHTGTGMFPDTRMTNQELADTLAYLAVLRREGTSTRQ